MQIVEIRRRFDDMLGDQSRIRVIEKTERILTEKQCRGWLRAQNWMPFPRRFGKEPQIVLQGLAGQLDIAVSQGRHATTELTRRHKDLDVIVVEDGHRGLSNGWIVVVGEYVHEIRDAWP